MVASLLLQVSGGWVAGSRNWVWLRWLGKGPSVNGWDVGWCASIRGRVNCFNEVGDSRGVGLLFRVAMVADMSAIAWDRSAIAASRRSAA